MAAASPHLELMTALLRTILGDRERSGQKESQNQKRGTPSGSCHKYGQGRKKKRYAKTNDT
jgi:hypothetical protein